MHCDMPCSSSRDTRSRTAVSAGSRCRAQPHTHRHTEQDAARAACAQAHTAHGRRVARAAQSGRGAHHAEAVQVRLLVALAPEQHLWRAPGKRACGPSSRLSTRTLPYPNPSSAGRCGEEQAACAEALRQVARAPLLPRRGLASSLGPPAWTCHMQYSPSAVLLFGYSYNYIHDQLGQLGRAGPMPGAAPKVPCSDVSTPVVSIRAMPTSCAPPRRMSPEPAGLAAPAKHPSRQMTAAPT